VQRDTHIHTGAPAASHAEIVRALAPFARPNTAKGVTLYLAEFFLYWGAIALVLFAPSMGWKVAGSLVAGFKLTAFLTLGHDAAHRTLVRGKTLNKCLAYACLVPCMHNLRLWIWDHHEVHHPATNAGHVDSYTPYSKQAFDRLPRRKQLFERIIRAPNGIGFGLHYLLQRMPRVRIVPSQAVPARHRKAAWADFAGLLAYQAAFLALLVAAPRFAPVSAAAAIVLGAVLPMLVFASVTGAALYLMHTHPAIPWFTSELERKGGAAGHYCATDLSVPAPVSRLVHHVFSHSVHHAHPGVPCYRVPQAQQRLNALLGGRAVSEPMSLRRVAETLRTCKLYDFERHQWLDFHGRPTTPPLALGRADAERPA
jgi:acyl-lipid omega-6 desaturase (Delta-12 desaturase)